MKLSISLGRIAVTLITVAIAAVVGWYLWDYYMERPWTRDGRVRADVVQVAPDVSGVVARVNVADNQRVHRGELLFTIDQDRYRLASIRAKPWSKAASPRWRSGSGTWIACTSSPMV